MTDKEIAYIVKLILIATNDARYALAVSSAITASIVFAKRGEEEALKFHEEYLALTKKYLTPEEVV